MTKYILMSCCEREICVLGVYDSLETAFDAMKSDFIAYHVDWGCENIENEIQSNINKTYETADCALYTLSAWSSIEGLHTDWQIERIEV